MCSQSLLYQACDVTFHLRHLDAMQSIFSCAKVGSNASPRQSVSDAEVKLTWPACAGLPGHLQAELALMSPSMVHRSLHSELGLLLLERIVEGDDESCYPGQPACMAVLAALCQIETSDVDACSRIVLGLCEVRYA